ncbi:class I SAM-dependent methyltransferase [Bradyrhizobium sp. ISRA443]|uniref:class I SAM-dependent methyltransferase n=1 Tax=unclassified Bradyrhizobium TaxID=2631580 RepID=UPI0024783EE7|nr:MULTISPECIES: class I SAM-dependent methyltransferase [unclassified Bradyrhizobium]WGR92932.1 class I SAM-dependent methyltransferase [Bradyrhizobium sp. ISRA435]WGR97426.1 class I SAM-dependent methyltransferase [Bradyrhizobium sp. ISRA436]WGS04314.1 class I SAM-dependent methyltransferase [Bradyrhizobium sp. ISRA437]WGS11198.1 class I SAM-dependent methyltransferase [Bradyrhizobium sp. ISRA443]
MQDNLEQDVAQRITGLYQLVRAPSIYKGLMFALGADNAIRRYVNEVLEPTPGIKMLDVGCGPANILAYLPSLDYTGIDLNEKHVNYARELYGNRGRFIVGNAANDLRQDENSFDLINVSALLHHLADREAITLFTSLKRLLKADGRIVTIDNVWLPQQRAAVKLINKLDSGLNIRRPGGYLELLNGLDFDVQTRVFHDLLRIPYDHIVMIARNSPRPQSG